jgi:hypothetical protein
VAIGHWLNDIDDSDDSAGIQLQWDKYSMFPFYPFNVLGVASAVQTGVYKRRPTVVSPAWTVFTVFETVNNQPSPWLPD